MALKGIKFTEEHKRKLSLAKKGKKFSREHKLSISKAKKGIPSPLKGRNISEEHKRKLREINLGRLGPNKGKKLGPMPEERKRKISKANSGSKSHLWRGGITSVNLLIRTGLEYRLWRASVFERDDYTCVWCGARNKKGNGKTLNLNADHIKPFANYPELRFVIDNGRTLCAPCHRTTDTYGGKTKTNIKDK